jgi:hypothetical protein
MSTDWLPRSNHSPGTDGSVTDHCDTNWDHWVGRCMGDDSCEEAVGHQNSLLAACND